MGVTTSLAYSCHRVVISSIFSLKNKLKKAKSLIIMRWLKSDNLLWTIKSFSLNILLLKS